MTRTRQMATVTHGLIIRPEPLARILDGRKVWEIRGTRTHLRGPIALIEAGTSQVVGVAEIVDVIGPMHSASLSRSPDKTGYSILPVEYDQYFAWVVQHARRLSQPVHYEHPNGAVIWVRLREEVAGRVGAQANVDATRSNQEDVRCRKTDSGSGRRRRPSLPGGGDCDAEPLEAEGSANVSITLDAMRLTGKRRG